MRIMPYGSDVMTVAEQLGVVAPSDMLHIVKDGKDVWVGYLDNLHPHTGTADCNTYELIQHEEVKRIACILEARSKNWKDAHLMPPLCPDEMPDYLYKDIQVKVYYTIFI